MRWLSIDPATKTGIARWEGPRLVSVATLRPMTAGEAKPHGCTKGDLAAIVLLDGIASVIGPTSIARGARGRPCLLMASSALPIIEEATLAAIAEDGSRSSGTSRATSLPCASRRDRHRGLRYITSPCAARLLLGAWHGLRPRFLTAKSDAAPVPAQSLVRLSRSRRARTRPMSLTRCWSSHWRARTRPRCGHDGATRSPCPGSRLDDAAIAHRARTSPYKFDSEEAPWLPRRRSPILDQRSRAQAPARCSPMGMGRARPRGRVSDDRRDGMSRASWAASRCARRVGRDSLAMEWMVRGRAPAHPEQRPYIHRARGRSAPSTHRTPAQVGWSRCSMARPRTRSVEHPSATTVQPDFYLPLEWLPDGGRQQVVIAPLLGTESTGSHMVRDECLSRDSWASSSRALLLRDYLEVADALRGPCTDAWPHGTSSETPAPTESPDPWPVVKQLAPPRHREAHEVAPGDPRPRRARRPQGHHRRPSPRSSPR
jgi:hypothetical protein